MVNNVNKNSKVKYIVELASLAGKTMLENGAETYRVEDTMERICSADPCIKNINTFVTPTGIFISVQSTSGESYIDIKRIKKRTTNLLKVYEVNNISRTLVSGSIDHDQALKFLGKLNKPVINYYDTILSAGLSAGFFALLFGGNLWDGLVASFGGAIIQFLRLSPRVAISGLIINIIGGVIAALFGIFFSIIIPIGNMDPLISGIIMPLLPGLAITSAIRDTIYGDLVSGTVRSVEALLIAFFIAFGVGFMLKLWTTFQGGLLLK